MTFLTFVNEGSRHGNADIVVRKWVDLEENVTVLGVLEPMVLRHPVVTSAILLQTFGQRH